MFHKIILVGNLGRDPEMRFTPSGVAVTNLSVATNRTYTNNNGDQVKETLWFRVSVWGKQAEACQQYLSKGRQVLVEGILQGDESGNPRIFQRKDGSSGASFEVRADTVRFIGSRGEGGDMGEDSGPGSSPDQEEDLPF
ncbi:MAG: single-stranded DNA-binding protein [Anaerolineales bacterium]|nr:single-stranded DNA-binding protein [Anaerolineales bacterium]